MAEKIKYLLLVLFVFCFGCISAQKQEKPKKLEFTVEGITFEMILVEGGRFMMGDEVENDIDCYEDEAPIHRVTLADFYIGKLEVTQELWRAVMHYNPSHFRGYKNPVENISWEDCQLFINRLNKLLGQNFRLPTEAEWEYAARGGNKSRGFMYSGNKKIKKVAWYWDNSKRNEHPVAYLMPNELGLYDMSGNVYEWCYDWYEDKYPTESQVNPKGPKNEKNKLFRRVIRGGSWATVKHFCRVANRDSGNPNLGTSTSGFRIVCRFKE